MPNKKFSIALTAILAIFTTTLFMPVRATAQEQVLYSFNSNRLHGVFPYASLVFDAAGNLYGTTSAGGSVYNGSGTVFELTPNAHGWSEKQLHVFLNNGKDGYAPAAGLIFDAAGNLYGTTPYGGAHNYGTVFELTPKSDGTWTETLLHSFDYNGTDGTQPFAPVIFDAAGNLYGTTRSGGSYLGGTAFELTPASGGGWTETVLHSFGSGTDGYGAGSGLVLDAAGNLYGTTFYGGAYGYGTIFQLTPAAGGGWTENVLHSFNFNGTDGYGPTAGLIVDSSGNLYGTTFNGGAHGAGAVFELSPAAGGGWTETLLHNFSTRAKGGWGPAGGLVLDAAGNLYGTTQMGGPYNSGTSGTAFMLSPPAGAGWTGKMLHGFGNGTDASSPVDALVLDAAGNLYGTTIGGGTYGYGAVFEIKQ